MKEGQPTFIRLNVETKRSFVQMSNYTKRSLHICSPFVGIQVMMTYIQPSKYRTHRPFVHVTYYKSHWGICGKKPRWPTFNRLNTKTHVLLSRYLIKYTTHWHICSRAQLYRNHAGVSSLDLVTVSWRSVFIPAHTEASWAGLSVKCLSKSAGKKSTRNWS